MELEEMAEMILEAFECQRRAYVDAAHVPFLETRFRIFDAYLASLSPEKFHMYTRLYVEEFETLHERLARRLQHSATHRAPISTRHRLCIFLRYAAHGTSFVQLSGEFAIGISTASTTVHEVAQSIVDELHSEAFPLPTRITWENSADAFRRYCRYPCAVAAMDGKHIHVVCPSDSGSTFFNYKGFYSIVILALVDANYRCLLYDLGAPGKCSDSGIYLTSAMKEFLESHFDDFPPAVQLRNIGKVEHHILVDQGFRLTVRFMRPYSQADAARDRRKAYFNKRMSSARRVVENYFGILSNRFRILLRPMYCSPSRAKIITLAVMILHNILVDAIGREAVVGRYGISSDLVEGRDGREPGQGGNVAMDAKIARERMMTFFARRDGVR